MAEEALQRHDGRRELIVVDSRPLFVAGLIGVFDDEVWRIVPVPAESVSDVPLAAGVALVALAVADVAGIVRALSDRDRRVAVYGNPDDPALMDAVETGAIGYLSDRSGGDAFLATARALRNGTARILPGLDRVAALRRSRRWSADSGFEGLSRREREVLESLAAGLRPSQIAERDFVSVTTVRNQVQAILTKLNVHSQLEAVAMAHSHGWLRRSA